MFSLTSFRPQRQIAGCPSLRLHIHRTRTEMRPSPLLRVISGRCLRLFPNIVLSVPLCFSCLREIEVVVWQVRSGAAPREIARSHVTQLTALFSKYREAWSPRSIQRAKSIGQFDPRYQLDFVDLGLLPAIEGEIHSKLDLLLNRALAQAIDPQTNRPRRVNERALFRAVFRFLAAKILQDRLHPLANAWDVNRIETVLDKTSQYYRLPALSVQPGTVEHSVFSLVWECIRGGINFQNISADDLAFVYESTLVTEEIRKAFGTHSTPRQVAEFIVCHLGISRVCERTRAIARV